MSPISYTQLGISRNTKSPMSKRGSHYSNEGDKSSEREYILFKDPRDIVCPASVENTTNKVVGMR